MSSHLGMRKKHSKFFQNVVIVFLKENYIFIDIFWEDRSVCLIYLYFYSILLHFSFLQTECLLLFDVWFLNKSVPPSY